MRNFTLSEVLTIVLITLALFCLTGCTAGTGVAKTPKPMTYTYKTVGNCPIEADVYLPAERSKPLPGIVYLHSGALMLNSRKEIIPEQLVQYLGQGYVVIAVDYRLAPETKLPEIISDLKDAFRWIYEQGPELFGVDPNRIGVVGRSAGGYLTLMAGVCIEPKPKVLVSSFGYGDLVGDWYTKPAPYYCTLPRVTREETGIRSDGPEVTSRGSKNEQAGKFYLYCRQNGLWPLEVGGHDPVKEREFFIPYCPLYNISADYPPTMLLHGDKDNDVPYEQSVMMAKALDRSGVENELVIVPGGGHGFDEDMDKPAVKEAFAKALTFLNEHLKK
jgi:acetyl esterase/lipase